MSSGGWCPGGAPMGTTLAVLVKGGMFMAQAMHATLDGTLSQLCDLRRGARQAVNPASAADPTASCDPGDRQAVVGASGQPLRVIMPAC